MSNNFLKKLEKYDFDRYLKLSTAQQGSAPAWVNEATKPGYVSGDQVTGFGVAKNMSNMGMAQTAAISRARTNAARLAAQKLGADPNQVSASMQQSQPEVHVQPDQNGKFTGYARVISPLSKIQVSNQQAGSPANQAQQKKAPAQGQAQQNAQPSTNAAQGNAGYRSGGTVKQRAQEAHNELDRVSGNAANARGGNPANFGNRGGNVRQNAQNAFDELDAEVSGNTNARGGNFGNRGGNVRQNAQNAFDELDQQDFE